MAREFYSDAKKYCACGVRLKDMAVHFDGGEYPQKCKASKVSVACVEVDITGNPV